MTEGEQAPSFAKYYYRRFREDQCTRMAASLAYSALLTMVPLLIIMFSILSWFPVFHGVGHNIERLVLDTFVPDYSDVISNQIANIVSQMHRPSWEQWVVFFAATLFVIYNLVNALNRIWRIKMRRHFTLELVMYAAGVLVLTIVLGLLFLVVPYMSIVIALLEHHLGLVIKQKIFFVLPYVIAWLTFIALNYFIPNTRVCFKYAVLAGTLTLVLFEFAKWVFGHYVMHFSVYPALYGTLSVIPLFLVWLYISWLIILANALWCCLLTESVTKSS